MPGQCWERESWGSGGTTWRMRVTTLSSMTERGETYPAHHCCRTPSTIQLGCQYRISPPPPSSEIQITQLSFCFRSFFFPFPGPGDGKLAPVNHSCSWVLMPLKVWHRAVIWDRSPDSGCCCSPARFPMGNGNHCSIYHLVFAAFPHTQEIPPQPKTTVEKGETSHSIISREQESYWFSLFQVIQCEIWHNKRSWRLKKYYCKI